METNTHPHRHTPAQGAGPGYAATKCRSMEKTNRLAMAVWSVNQRHMLLLLTLLSGWTSRTKGGIMLTASCLLMLPCPHTRHITVYTHNDCIIVHTHTITHHCSHTHTMTASLFTHTHTHTHTVTTSLFTHTMTASLFTHTHTHTHNDCITVHTHTHTHTQ